MTRLVAEIAENYYRLMGLDKRLELLDQINPSLSASYQPYWAVRAHLLLQLGSHALSAAAYTSAVELTTDEAVRRFLLQRRQAAANFRERLSK